MSWHYSRALVEEYSAATCLGGGRFALLSESHTPQAFLYKDRMTAFSRLSRFGMTFAPLTEILGADLLTWFLADSRVRTYQLLGMVQASMASAQDCGEKWRESSARYDLGSSSWKTHLCLWQEDLPWSSVILPKWGMTLNGAVYQHPTLERPISGIGFGLWPTPIASEWKNGCGKTGNRSPEKSAKAGLKLAEAVRMYPTPRSCSAMAATITDKGDRFPNLETVIANRHPETVGGQLNPTWVEWLMGWPQGWTDLKPLAMDRFREWQQQHSL